MKQIFVSFVIMIATAAASTVIITTSTAQSHPRPIHRMVNLGIHDLPLRQ